MGEGPGPDGAPTARKSPCKKGGEAVIAKGGRGEKSEGDGPNRGGVLCESEPSLGGIPSNTKGEEKGKRYKKTFL